MPSEVEIDIDDFSVVEAAEHFVPAETPVCGESRETENGRRAVRGSTFIEGASEEQMAACLAINDKAVRDSEAVLASFLERLPEVDCRWFLRTIAFNRDSVDGKGERDCTYQMLTTYLRKTGRVPVVLGMLAWFSMSSDDSKPLGYWGDLRSFEHYLREKGCARESWFAEFRRGLMQLFADQLLVDLAKVESYEAALASAEDPSAVKAPGISLAAKWAPKEKRKHNLLSSSLANLMFPESRESRKLYRQLLSRLTRHIGLIETFMTEKRLGEWDDPSTIPAKAFRKYRKALTSTIGSEDPGKHLFGEKLDAILNGTSDKKLKTAGLQFYELTTKIHAVAQQLSRARHYGGGEVTALQKELMALEAQAGQIVAELKKAVEEGSFPVSVAIVDVSGSMSGIPMEVAVSLGLLLANIMPGVWGGRMITFHETPSWHLIDTSRSLHDQIVSIRGAPWGGSTDWDAALKLVMDLAREPRFMPKMFFCFSDMQFNQTHRSRSHLNPIDGARKMYRDNGFELPQIVFWNLRASGTGTFAAPADADGVAMLSGFSQSLFKGFMTGDLDSFTPLSIFRRQLENPRYDVVDRLMAL